MTCHNNAANTAIILTDVVLQLFRWNSCRLPLSPCPPVCQPVEMPPPGPNSSPGTWNFKDITQNGQHGSNATPLSLSMHLGERKMGKKKTTGPGNSLHPKDPKAGAAWECSQSHLLSDLSAARCCQVPQFFCQTQHLAHPEASPRRAGLSQPPQQDGVPGWTQPGDHFVGFLAMGSSSKVAVTNDQATLARSTSANWGLGKTPQKQRKWIHIRLLHSISI